MAVSGFFHKTCQVGAATTMWIGPNQIPGTDLCYRIIDPSGCFFMPEPVRALYNPFVHPFDPFGKIRQESVFLCLKCYKDNLPILKNLLDFFNPFCLTLIKTGEVKNILSPGNSNTWLQPSCNKGIFRSSRGRSGARRVLAGFCPTSFLQY
jgi:hypothetical protein